MKTSEYKAGVDFSDMLRSGQFSDLTLVCQGKEFKIHKLVACPQSPVFSAAVNGEFKEARTGIIQIELFDTETVRRMVEFLYTGNYDDQPSKQSKAVAATPAAVASGSSSAPTTTSTAPPVPTITTGKQKTLHHVRVNAIADYYGIRGLTLLANQKIQQAFNNKWDAKAFLSSAKEALSVSGDKTLHGMMALLAAQNMRELLASAQLTDLVGDFAAEILRYHAHKLEAAEQEQNQNILQQQADLVARCQAAEARTGRVIENIGRLVTTMCDRDYCRNGACEENFGCYIEQHGDVEPTFVLRCSWCQCRHY